MCMQLLQIRVGLYEKYIPCKKVYLCDRVKGVFDF